MSASVAIRFNAATHEAERAFTGLTRTVAGFEKSFAGVASSLQGHQQRINEAFGKFSGDNLIRQANELTAAIQKLGGASKLTEAEQRNVNATLTEALAKYKALGQEAPKAVLDLANATKQLEQPTQQASKWAGFLGSTFAQFTAANLAASAIQNVVGRMSEFVAQGTKLPGLESAFNRMTTGMGLSSQKMLSTLQDSTRGLVSNLDLMQSTNKAVLLGLPVTESAMGDLAKSATALGRAMGLDATQSLNDLITALGRSSPLILDNLGLTVKVGEANEAYAAKLGKTSNELTDVEKKTAFYEAAMEAARRKTEELGEQTLTLSERIDRAWVAIENAATKSVSNMNVVLGQATRSWKDFFNFISDSAQFKSWEDQRQAIEESMAPPDGAKRKRTPGGSQEFLFEELQRQARETAAALEPLTAAQRELALQFDKGGLSAKEITDRLNSVAKTSGVTERQIAALTEQTKKSAGETQRYREEIKALQDRFSGAALQGEVNKVAVAFRSLTEEQRQSPAVMDRVADAAMDLSKQGATLTTDLFLLTLETGKFQEAANRGTLSVKAFAAAFPLVTGEVKKTAQELTFLADLIKDMEGKVGPPKQLPGIVMSGIDAPEPLPPTFWQNFLGGENGESFTEGARRSADILIGALADGVATGDWSNFKDTLQYAFSEFAASALAAGVNFLVPGLGTLLQPLFSALTTAFTNLFRDVQHETVNDMRDAFLNSIAEAAGLQPGDFVGFHELARQLHELGPLGDQLFQRLLNADKVDEFNRAMRDVNEALARVPSNMAAAAGFKTRDELIELARQAQQTYEYIRDSGLYTADAVQEAWERSIAAQKKAFGDTKAFMDIEKIKSNIAEINREYDRLWNSVKDEMPEEITADNPFGMGIEEKRARDRMAELAAQREEEQKKLDEAMQNTAMTFTEHIGEGLQVAAREFAAALRGIVIHPVGTPPPVTYGPPSGPAPHVPVGGPPGWSPGYTQNISIEVDGEVLAQKTVRHMPSELILSGT